MKRIVLIDDDQCEFELLLRAAKDKAEIHWYTSFTHAKTFIKIMKEKIDLVVSDLNGVTFAREIKDEIAALDHPNVWVISNARKPDWNNGNFVQKGSDFDDRLKEFLSE